MNYSAEKSPFPYREIKSELEKTNSAQFDLILQNKNYPAIQAISFENIQVAKFS